MLIETLADYERLAERLGHPPALGLTLDIGHIVCLEPMSVTECVRRGAPTLAHVHIEDMKRGVHEHLEFGTGELDLEEALAVLNEVAYEGMVAVELSRHSHAAHEMVPRAMAALRAAGPGDTARRFAPRRATVASEVGR
jgi:sugar phosphate isomerase/epimerase